MTAILLQWNVETQVVCDRPVFMLQMMVSLLVSYPVFNFILHKHV
jgi:hypothetical protein